MLPFCPSPALSRKPVIAEPIAVRTVSNTEEVHEHLIRFHLISAKNVFPVVRPVRQSIMSNVKKPSITLRRSLQIRFGLLVASAVLLMGLGFFLVGLKPMIGRIAENQFAIASAQVEAGLDSVFNPAEQILKMSPGWFNGDSPDLGRPDDFNRLFRPVLDVLPQVTSVVAGTSIGEGWMLLHQPDGSWRNRMTDRKHWGEQQLFYELAADGKEQRYWKSLDYDPRKRSWYEIAMADQRSVQWTAPYTFFTTGDPGITASTHFLLKDGRDFVIGLDLMLRDLSRTTMGARVGQHGMAVVLTEDLRVLALPTTPAGVSHVAWHGNVLKEVAALKLAPLTDALVNWHSGVSDEVNSYRSGDTTWLTRKHAYTLGKNRLWVVTIAPEADFSPDWLPVAGILFAGLAVMLVLTTFFSRRQANRIARPLEALAERSERIGQLDFQDSPLETSEITEVGKLAAAQEKMRVLLHSNQLQLAAQEDALRNQIDVLRAAEAKLVDSEALQQALIRALPDLVWLKDPDGVYLSCNPRFEQFFGALEKDIVGKTDHDFVDKDLADSFREKDRIAMAKGTASVNEEWIRFADDGHRELLETTKTPMFDVHGRLFGVLGIGHDITERNAHANQLKHIAHYDVLTTLPNRVLLADRLHQAMAQAERSKLLLTVAYLDLDGFKAINDNHGHDAGDKLLIALASRMKQTLREVDTLARLGGDEFVAVMLDLPDVAASVPMITRLLFAAAEPVQVGELELRVSASLGVTFYPQAEDVDADQLLRQADQAMYQAKLAGKNRFHLFDTEQDRSVRGHHESLERIRRGLTEHEFVLHYQPKVNMRTGTVIGAEALIRWQHPERGLLSPALFLPAIENHPLAIDVGRWVIDTALSQMELWRAIGLNIPLSVNVGAQQLQQEDFVERLREILAAHPTIPASDLEMEVLETSALEDVARVSDVIESCRELGVLFSLDDFGTGYSSLTYLKRLSVNQLKIDQSFVRDMLDDPDDLAILGGVLSLATAFHREVIAEGVETVAHGTMLLQLGCELAQGYGIARPMAGEDLPAWVRSWQPDPAWSKLPAVNRDDQPLLFAGVEHRAWIAAVEGFINGERENLPLIHHQCSFSAWLETDGQARHGEQLAFQAIKSLHQQVHVLANKLCELCAQQHAVQAQTRLSELFTLRDALLAQLKILLGTGLE